MPPEELFEAEREAAGRAFDAHLREPILAAFDEKTSAALDD
jgi:hypothetical protein